MYTGICVTDDWRIFSKRQPIRTHIQVYLGDNGLGTMHTADLTPVYLRAYFSRETGPGNDLDMVLALPWPVLYVKWSGR